MVAYERGTPVRVLQLESLVKTMKDLQLSKVRVEGQHRGTITITSYYCLSVIGGPILPTVGFRLLVYLVIYVSG